MRQCAIQRIDFVGQLKDVNGINANGTQSVFVLIFLEKINKAKLTFS